MTEVEMAFEEPIEKEDAAETEQRVVDNQKKAKDSQDRENAENIRKKAMERLGQTQKRKVDENESEGKRRKKRSSGSDTLNFLGEKKINRHRKCKKRRWSSGNSSSRKFWKILDFSRSFLNTVK